MRKTLLVIWLLSSLISTVSAQVDIRGRITDSLSHHGVDDVLVTLSDAAGKTLMAQTFTDAEGRFELKVNRTVASDERLLLSTMRMNYIRKKVELTGGHHSNLSIEIIYRAIKLREVKIKAQPIKQRGDTLTYLASSFTQKGDRTLENIIARMPGIEVKENGSIFYGGKRINRFYIEDMNLLGQRYTQATRNLRPEDVASVQVYENHEPIKMLRKTSDSDQAALNIRLREGAKARWLIRFAGSLGTGANPILYDMTANVMRFAKRNQTLALLKANNTGKDLISEFELNRLSQNKFFALKESDDTSDFFWQMPVQKSLLKSYDASRFNTSGGGALNHLMKPTDDATLRYNGLCVYDRSDYMQQKTILYRMPDGSETVMDDYTEHRRNTLKSENEVHYECNAEAFYLENKAVLNTDARWSHDAITQNGTPLLQDMNLPRLTVGNHLSIKKKWGNWICSAEDKTEWMQRNQSLALDGKPVQKVGSSLWSHTLKVQAAYTRGRHAIDLKAGWLWQKHSLRLPMPTLPNWEITDRQMIGLSDMNLSPSYKYKFPEGSYIRIGSTLSLLRYAGSRQEDNSRYLRIEPYLLLHWEPENHHKVDVDYSMSNSITDIEQMFLGLIRRDFRTFTSGLHTPLTGKKHQISASWQYTHPMSGIRYSATSAWSFIRTDMGQSGELMESNILYRQVSYGTVSRGCNHLISASKLFLEQKLDLSLDLMQSLFESESLQQQVWMKYVSRSYGIRPKIGWYPAWWFSLDYDMSLSISRLDNRTLKQVSEAMGHSHGLKSTVWLSDHFALIPDCKYRYDRLSHETPVSLFLMNLGLVYTYKQMDIMLDLTNLTDRKFTVIHRHTGVNTISRYTRLRPRELMLTLRIRK